MSKYQITVAGTTYEVEVGDVSASPVQVLVDGQAVSVAFEGGTPVAAAAAAAPVAAPKAAPKAEAAPAPAPAPVGAVAGEVVKAPMPGKILSVTVAVGDAIAEGDTVCTLEAMKMEMPIAATAAGTVKAVHIAVGQNVANDDALVTVG